MTDLRTPAQVALRPAVADDVEGIAELRAIVLRPDLERLGRYDDIRVRQRFRDAFEPADTRIILVDGEDCGSVALRREDVLQGSPARRLYERHGFRVERQDEIDVFLKRDRIGAVIDRSDDR